MATFLFEGHEIYYEEHGSGDALVVLNGIFMSCASWQAFLPAFAARNRLVLVDMIDQGKSEKVNFEYTQEIQVRVVEALLAHLKLETVNLMGISYGGEVAMQFAIQNPAKVNRLVLSNTAPNTSAWLRDIGHSWEYAYQSYDGHQFFKTCIPIIYSPQFYEANYEWASAREEMFVRVFTPDVYDAFGRLTRSAEGHDVRDKLHGILAKTLVVSSEYDYVTPLYQQVELAQKIPCAGHVVVQGAGHAVMYEKPAEFAALVLGFMENTEEIITVQ